MHLLFRFILFPILMSIWIIEYLVIRLRKINEWQINTYQVTFLFLTLTAASWYLVLYANCVFANIIGLYIATAMQVLSLILSFIVGFGKSPRLHNIIQQVGVRKREKLSNTRTNEGVYRVFISYIYSIYFFGIIYHYIYRMDQGAFVFSTPSHNLTFDFFYYSVLVLTLFNNPINAESVLAKLMTICEIIVGLMFVIFIFNSIIAFHVNNPDKP